MKEDKVMSGPQRDVRSRVQCVSRFNGRNDIHLMEHREGNSLDGSW